MLCMSFARTSLLRNRPGATAARVIPTTPEFAARIPTALRKSLVHEGATKWTIRRARQLRIVVHIRCGLLSVPLFSMCRSLSSFNFYQRSPDCISAKTTAEEHAQQGPICTDAAMMRTSAAFANRTRCPYIAAYCGLYLRRHKFKQNQKRQ